VTTNDLAVGDSANYSCWPGYTHITGDLNRTCLSTLVWSGRLPTCKLTCTSKILQQCLQCEGEDDQQDVCAFKTQQTNSQECLELLRPELNVSSVYFKTDGSTCYKYVCEKIFDDWSDKINDWTARYTCSKGSLTHL